MTARATVLGLVAATFLRSAAAPVTNVVDLAALAAFGNTSSGVTNGWEAGGIDSYADAVVNIRLSEIADYLVSPDYGVPIAKIILQVRSSSEKAKRLVISPWTGFDFATDRWYPCEYSPTVSAYVREEFDFAEEPAFTRFKLGFDVIRGATGWGVRELLVITDGEPVHPPPEPRFSDGAVSLASCLVTRHFVFKPDFSRLCTVTNGTPVDGFEPRIGAFLLTNGVSATVIGRNAGLTQTKGHYVWSPANHVSGFGSYSSSGISYAFGWCFRNDTGFPVRIDALHVVYGQWNARNSKPDRLSFEWKISSILPAPDSAEDWQNPEEASFVARTAEESAEMSFPAYESRTIRDFPIRLPADAFLTVRWTDTCPAKGHNAAMGLASVCLKGHLSPPANGIYFR